MTEKAVEEPPAYSIRPNFKQKFRPAIASKVIHQILADRLTGATYHPDTCSQWTREIADEVKNRLKELDLPRYKYIVNVVIGEMRGEGVRMGCRCFWDADTDNVAQDTFINDSLFCVAVAFGVFYY
ncbi:Tctex-1 family-domain-containing protein [Phlyctochytrium arcticum]|nr:Tctex-1 family-domain-containing protein [Phlyctochytrium arcticum]